MRKENRIGNGSRHEMLRLAVALYVMGAAIGLWTAPGGAGPLEGLFGPALAADLYALALFGAAWCILVGLRLQWASLVLMALVLGTAGAGGSTGMDEILLVGLLLPLAGALRRREAPGPDIGRIRLHHRPTKTGRIRLRRIRAASCSTRRPALRSGAPAATHPFSQSPDELTCLFDQIGEVRQG